MMAGIAFYNLPPALALNGGEILPAYQQGPTEATPWIGVQITTAQIVNLVSVALNLPSYGFVSMRQLFSALAGQGVLVSLADQLPGDITNPFNIAWNHAYIMSLGDPFITGFLQPALGYTQAQVQNLFNYAADFPIGGALLPPSPFYVSMRQLIAALASQSVLLEVFQAVPGDITNTYTIAWQHANVMNPNDQFVTGFLQPTLGYSDMQIQELFTIAQTFPV